MQRKVILGSLHLLFWIVTSWLIISSFSIQAQEVEIIDGHERIVVIRDSRLVWQLILLVGFSVVMSYLNLGFLLRIHSRWRLPRALVASLAIMAAAILVYWFLSQYSGQLFTVRLPDTITFSILIFFYATSVAYGIGLIWQRTERQRQRLQLEKKQAELHLLRSQLQPHFLFNVLNNLLSLVDQRANPVLAESIDRLSGLLRYVVYETAEEQVLLTKELHFLQQYADLQLLRFEPQEVTFEMMVSGPIEGCWIEPGIFLPFLENAFKFGVEPEGKSNIQLRLTLREDGWLDFRITNPIFPELYGKGAGGSGLNAVRERLSLVYPQSHHLQITQQETFSVHLEIQTRASINN